MIQKEELKNIVFAKYDYYLGMSKQKHSTLKRFGVHPDEIVNEAILGALDAKCEFHSEAEVNEFVVTAMTSIGYYEKGQLKKKSQHDNLKNSDGESVISDMVNSGNTDKEFEYSDTAFIKSSDIYDCFYEMKYGTQDITCNTCGHNRVVFNVKTNSGKTYYRCLMCNSSSSIFADTYLRYIPLPYSKVYLSIVLVCRNPLISIVEYSIAMGWSLKQSTIERRGRTGMLHHKFVIKIRRAIENIASTDVNLVLRKLPTIVKFDPNPIKNITLYDTKQIKDPDKVRREFIDGKSIEELCFQYKRSTNCIRDVLDGRTHNSIDKMLMDLAKSKLMVHNNISCAIAPYHAINNVLNNMDLIEQKYNELLNN